MTKSELEPYLNSLSSGHSIALLFHTDNGTYIATEVNFSDGDTVVFSYEQRFASLEIDDVQKVTALKSLESHLLDT